MRNEKVKSVHKDRSTPRSPTPPAMVRRLNAVPFFSFLNLSSSTCGNMLYAVKRRRRSAPAFTFADAQERRH